MRFRVGVCAMMVVMLVGMGLADSNGRAESRHALARNPLHPIVCDAFLVGGSRNGHWLTEKQIWRKIKGGENYRVYGPTSRLGVSVGKAARTDASASGEQPTVELKPGGNDEANVALCADWNALPRPVTAFDRRQAAYVGAVADILKQHGMGAAHVNITRILQVDLDGDGTKEVLLAATTPKPEYPTPVAARNDYSFVLARRIVNGKVKTKLIEGYFGAEVSKLSEATPEKFVLIGAYDLNGDGKMEIVTRSSYYEGASVTVYRLGSKGVTKVLEVGDGA